jgi:hypothetical protein
MGGNKNLFWGRIPFQAKDMMKKSILAIMVAASPGLAFFAQADEIQFTTLPQNVQTTVIRETHIASPTGVLRVIHDSTGVYAVTVRGTEGDQVVYVNEMGAIVQAPVGTQQTVTTYTDVQKSQSRYELLEKKGDKEIYMDHQTGQKVTVKREQD